MSRRFDEATRLEPCGNGRYELEVEEGDYWGVVTPHGGYLMALMFEAMQLEVAQAERRPRSLVQHFLGRIAPGRVTIEVTIERTSRAVTSVTARMQSGENVAGLALELTKLRELAEGKAGENMTVALGEDLGVEVLAVRQYDVA